MSVAYQPPSQLKVLRTFVANVVSRLVPPPILARMLPFSRSPVAEATWEHEYATGYWNYLANMEQLARYSVIAGYCSFLSPAARILDVGCGAGLLAHRLPREAISAYLGIDLSQAAIDQARDPARGSNIPPAEFLAADATTFEPPHAFDVIVFNEFLVYVQNAEEQVRRYARSLAPGGMLVVSMSYTAHSIKIWKKLEAGFETLDRVRIAHGPSRKKWNVAVLKPR